MKADARAAGKKPPVGIKPFEVKDADLKKVSVERLSARLGLTRYDVPAPISDAFTTKSVKIPLCQHIGVPAILAVSEGDTVKAGDVIGTAKDGALSVNIHASIDGRVTTANEKFVRIAKQ